MVKAVASCALFLVDVCGSKTLLFILYFIVLFAMRINYKLVKT